MRNIHDSKPYDLEERTFQFAKASCGFVKQLPNTIENIEDVNQFVRAPARLEQTTSKPMNRLEKGISS
jgi:hypothetical protein